MILCSYTPDIAISTSACGGTSFIPGEELILICNGETQWRFNGLLVDDDSDMFDIISFNDPLSSILQFDPAYTNQHSGNYTCFTTEEESSITITTQSMCVCLSDCVYVCVLCMCLYTCLYMCVCVVCMYYVCVLCVCLYVCVCVVCVCIMRVCVVCVLCVCVFMYVCVYMCAHVCMCLCLYTINF